MWTTVYVTTSRNSATKIEKLLRDEGFLIKVKDSTYENKETLYEILVLEYEAKDAQEVLLEKGIL